MLAYFPSRLLYRVCFGLHHLRLYVFMYPSMSCGWFRASVCVCVFSCLFSFYLVLSSCGRKAGVGE